MGLLDQARSLQLEISENNSFLDTCTYSILICGMCRNGLLEEASHIFTEMKKLGCSPSVVTFNSFVDGLCKAGADRVLDSASLQKMVEKLCESDRGKPEALLSFLKSFNSRGIPLIQLLMGHLLMVSKGLNREDEAFKLFQQMSENGCMPSSEVYKSLMTWSCRRGKISVAFSLWLKYLRSQSFRDGDAIGLIEKYFEKDHMDKAVQGLLEMDLKLEDFDSSPYNIWLIGLCQVNKPAEALKIFYLLKKFGVTISAPSCAKLIHSLCEGGNLDQAVEVFLYTVDRGIHLMPRICNILLQSLLCSQDTVKHAIDLLERMRSTGYNLNAYLYIGTKSLFQRWNLSEIENLSSG